jgi:16S rRNA (guanine966-N2)-methyltransferase
MRIISGTCGGRRLNPPKGLPVRPTTDLAKEALFNILNNRIDFEGLRVLDLCCGTGSISLEFASRGALSVTAVDSNRACAAFVRAAAGQLGLKVDTVVADVTRFLHGHRTRYDLIFCDLPYALPLHHDLVSVIFQNGSLADEGILIMEHGPDTDLADMPHFKELRAYGKVRFSFFGASQAQ